MQKPLGVQVLKQTDRSQIYYKTVALHFLAMRSWVGFSILTLVCELELIDGCFVFKILVYELFS